MVEIYFPKSISLIIGMLFIATSLHAQIYVDSAATGANNGSDWTNAFTDLQDALDAACADLNPAEIWVAAGTYYPTSNSTGRGARFRLCNDVAIYGGFTGIETMLSERDWESNPTILSGDINQSGTLAGNSYTVVTGSGTNATAVIDGFTITMGNADVTSGNLNSSNRSGGGMYTNSGSPTITNCTFSGNSANTRGGGMFNFFNSSPTVTNSTFSGNTASGGGGMYNIDFSSPTVTNSTFSGNMANLDGGGMFNRDNSSPTVTNSTFSGNMAIGGGGMFNINFSSPTVTNSTFSGNMAQIDGGGMYNFIISSPTVTNSIFWNNSAGGSTASASASMNNITASNPTFSYSLIANSGGSGSWDSAIGMDGGNNIDADPLFVAPLTPGLNTGGNYRLQDCSLAIDAGSNDAVPSGVTTDLDRNPRFFNSGVVDLGAYEFQGFTQQPEIICLNQTIVFNGESDISLNGEDMFEIIEICGEADFSLSQTAISCEQIGQVISVEVTVTDLFNNTATCTSQITVTGLPCGFTQNPDGVNCTNGNEVTFNPTTEEWNVTSTNCYYASPFNSDATAFAQHTLCGNGSITAQVTGISGTALGWAGVVMRETNAAGAKKAQLTTNLSNFSRREFRTVTNGSAFPQQFLSFNSYWLRLTRTGNQFIMEVSSNGSHWFFAGVQNIVMNSCIEVGLVVTNYNSNSTVTGTFANVSVTGSNMIPLGNDSDPTLLVNYDNQQGLRDIKVYPNPTSGELNIALTGFEGRPVTLEVYNTIGQIIFMKEVNEVESTDEIIDLSYVASGMYLIRVTSEGLPAEMKRVMVAR